MFLAQLEGERADRHKVTAFLLTQTTVHQLSTRGSTREPTGPQGEGERVD